MNVEFSRRGVGFALLGLVLYLMFLLATIPAYWLGEGLVRLTEGRVRLQHAAGSIWHGTGLLIIGPHNLAIEWDLQSGWLLLGKAHVQVKSRGDSSLRATLTIGYRHLALRDTAVELPATVVAVFYPPVSFIAPTGKLRFTTSEMEIGSKGMTGEALLIWSGAGGKLGGVGEVGDYQLTATGSNGMALLKLGTLRGEIGITGAGQWQVAGDGRLRLDGTLAPGSRESMIAPILPLLNAQRSGDQYTFSLSAQLPVMPNR